MWLKGATRLAALDSRNAADADKREARSWIMKANRADPDDPRALISFYLSYSAPSENAAMGLARARELLPQSAELTLLYAQDRMTRKQFQEALHLLEPVANAVHGGEEADLARKLIAQIRAEIAKAEPANPPAQSKQPASPTKS